MDQSASSIVKLGQVMLDRSVICKPLTSPNDPTWSLTNQRARSGLKGQHVGFLDIGHVDVYPDVDIHPDVDILSTHQY